MRKKTLIVMEAIRDETSVAEICRKHGIAQSMFYKFNKRFLEQKTGLPMTVIFTALIDS